MPMKRFPLGRLPRVQDVAAYVLRRRGPMRAMKLQRLVYYCQAWSLAWDGKPLFPEKVQAWMNGPVVPELFLSHRGRFLLASLPDGDAAKLTAAERGTVDAVLKRYGGKSSFWLGELAHREAPWRNARAGVAEDDPETRPEIPRAAMRRYYSALR
jgi:uncharacterized phage-associated protein